MDEEWDNEDFQPKEINIPEAALANKWEGEDEDDEVKDNWEDEEEEEEEKKDVEKQELQKPQAQKKGKKALVEKIEEKEQRKREDALKKQAGMEPKKELTPEELAAEKLRQQKLQEDSDLQVAMETFGVVDPNATGIDAMNPTTKEEFDEFQDALSKKILIYTKSPHFSGFAEEFIRNICVNLSSNDLKKLKTTIENMFLEKTKVEKGDKAKKKGKVKAKLRVEGENALVNEYSAYDLDDYDDFM